MVGGFALPYVDLGSVPLSSHSKDFRNCIQKSSAWSPAIKSSEGGGMCNRVHSVMIKLTSVNLSGLSM